MQIETLRYLRNTVNQSNFSNSIFPSSQVYIVYIHLMKTYKIKAKCVMEDGISLSSK